MRLNALISTLALTLLAGPALADNQWTVDSNHSAASFKVRHMMVSNVNGTISGVKGTVTYDGNVKDLKVDVTLDPATVNTNEPDRDTHLKSEDFFDTKKFPTMSFKSKKVEAAGDKYKLIGDLTMHGVTKEVALDMDAPSPIVKDKKGKESVGTSATTKVNRKDFGMTWNHQLDNGGVVLSEQIDVTLDVEANRKPQNTATTK